MREWRIRNTLVGIMLVALLMGVACFIVVPPWWHYDEPGHFEYVWLVAHSPTWPVVGQYDQSMRKEMAVSMLKYGWYGIRNFEPDLNGIDPIAIGIPQIGERPGYYLLASLPLRLMTNADITLQYDAARFASLLLYLLIIIVVWYALGEILPEDHPLRWMTTVFVALLPAFADEMISVNNDVSAVLASSLFVWASLRLIQRGYSVGRILFLAASLAACYLSKNTSLFAFLVAPLVLILGFLRGRFMGFVWSAVLATVILLAVVVLRWGNPTGWYQEAPNDFPARIEMRGTPLGNYAFEFDDSTTSGPAQILQILSPDQVESVRGETLTLGAWIWANEPTQAELPSIRFQARAGDLSYSAQTPVGVTTERAFHMLTVDVPIDAHYANVYIQENGHGLMHNAIYVDGVVLVPGEFGTKPPYFMDTNGDQGVWDEKKFTNLLSNASAEQGSFQIRKWVSDKTAPLSENSGINLPLILVTIQDWKNNNWYYQGVAKTLFRTFWASLAGDKAFLRSSTVSNFLLVFSLLGLLGACIRLWMHRHNLRLDLIGFLGVSLILPWLVAVTRGTSTFLQTLTPLYPWARYAYPAILATALLLCAGWLQWLEIFSIRLKLGSTTMKMIFLSIMLGISVFALLNAIQVLRPSWWGGWVSLALLFVLQYMIFGVSTNWRPRKRP